MKSRRSRRWRWVALCAASLAGAAPLPFASAQDGLSADVEVADLLDRIESASAKQERLEGEGAELSAERDRVRQQLRSHVRALYRVTRPGLSPLLGGVEAVLQHVARVKRLRRLVETQANRLTTLHARAATLRSESTELAQSLETARGRLTALQSTPPSAGSSLGGLLPSDDSAFREPDGNFYGMRLSNPEPAANFEAERGKLASPIVGDLSIVAGRRAEGDGPGLEFRAAVGTPVRAASAGRVAFSDRYGSYGRLVILDHGSGYYTVYGGLGAVEVRVGDDLSRQARIGIVGTDFSPSALFFEVRKGTRAMDPRSWLGF